jgi:DinB superfamily
MDRSERLRSVERYREGHDAVLAALDGITDRELDARPEPQAWSVREIVHHLADSEMTAAIRLRRLIAEDRPTIEGYDQDAFALRLHYDRPIDASLDAVAASRATTVDLLDRLTDAEWERTGTHTESGPYSVDAWLEIYAAHAHDHAEQISRVRRP